MGPGRGKRGTLIKRTREKKGKGKERYLFGRN